MPNVMKNGTVSINLITDHAVEKCVTEEEIAKRNSIFYNHIEINKDKK